MAGMNSLGCKIYDTPICVDYWNVNNATKPSDQFYFLSHAHDHSMFGLTPSWRHRIYCSSKTAAIVTDILEIPPDQFVVIVIGKTTLIDCSHIEGLEGKYFNVTALESDHCLGSTMFIFDGWFGRVLVTGGFRFENEEKFEMHRLKESPFDQIYVDATNWKMEDEEDGTKIIHTRIWSTVKTLEILAKRPSDETIFVVTPDCVVGQERLLAEIAQNFDHPITVSERRFQILQDLDMSEFFTIDPQQTRFRVLNGTRGQIIRAFKDEVACGKRAFVIVFVTPTSADYWKEILISKTANDYEFRQCVQLIPYSDHSSKQELEKFLEQLKIRRLFPIGRRFDDGEVNMLRERFEMVTPTDEDGEEVDSMDVSLGRLVILTQQPCRDDSDDDEIMIVEEKIVGNPGTMRNPKLEPIEIWLNNEDKENGKEFSTIDDGDGGVPDDPIITDENNMQFTDAELEVMENWGKDDLLANSCN